MPRTKERTSEVKPPAPPAPPPEAPANAPLEAPPAEAGEPVFLTPYELSRRWSWSVRPRTLQNWRSSGRGPACVKLGTKVVYRLEDVEAFERTSGRAPRRS